MKKGKKLPYRVKRKINGLIFVAPFLIGFIAFFLIPIINTVYLGKMLAVHQCPNLKLDFSVLKNFDFRTIEPKIDPAEPLHSEKVFYHRSPRNMESLDTDTIEIEAPPAPNRSEDIRCRHQSAGFHSAWPFSGHISYWKPPNKRRKSRKTAR